VLDFANYNIVEKKYVFMPVNSIAFVLN